MEEVDRKHQVELYISELDWAILRYPALSPEMAAYDSTSVVLGLKIARNLAERTLGVWLHS